MSLFIVSLGRLFSCLTRSAVCVASLNPMSAYSFASAFGLGLSQHGLSSALYDAPYTLPLSYPLSHHSAPLGYRTGYDSLSGPCVLHLLSRR